MNKKRRQSNRKATVEPSNIDVDRYTPWVSSLNMSAHTLFFGEHYTVCLLDLKEASSNVLVSRRERDRSRQRQQSKTWSIISHKHKPIPQSREMFQQLTGGGSGMFRSIRSHGPWWSWDQSPILFPCQQGTPLRHCVDRPAAGSRLRLFHRWRWYRCRRTVS